MSFFPPQRGGGDGAVSAVRRGAGDEGAGNDPSSDEWPEAASHFVHTPLAGYPPDREHRTQVGRVLERLDIELMVAHSPQARGRCERMIRGLAGTAATGVAVARDPHLGGGEPVPPGGVDRVSQSALHGVAGSSGHGLCSGRPDRSGADLLSPGEPGGRSGQHGTVPTTDPTD